MAGEKMKNPAMSAPSAMAAVGMHTIWGRVLCVVEMEKETIQMVTAGFAGV